MNVDVYTIIFLQSFRNHAFDFLAIFFSYLFSAITLLIFSIIILFLFIFKRIRKILLIELSFLTSAIFLKIMKEVIRRPRPNYLLDLPISEYSQYSFPSGHTLFSFLFAAILSHYYPKYKYAFYLIAIATGISRLYLGLHYLSDVVFGGFFGLIISKIFLLNEKKILKLEKKLLSLIFFKHL